MIACSECDESYIGKTIREASSRHQEHGAPQQPKPPSITLTTVPQINDHQLRRSDRLRTKQKINYYLGEKEDTDKP